MTVYVVTNVEAGWDCVYGVFGTLKALRGYLAPEEDWNKNGSSLKKNSPYYNTSLRELKKLIEKGPLIIHEKELEE